MQPFEGGASLQLELDEGGVDHSVHACRQRSSAVEHQWLRALARAGNRASAHTTLTLCIQALVNLIFHKEVPTAAYSLSVERLHRCGKRCDAQKLNHEDYLGRF